MECTETHKRVSLTERADIEHWKKELNATELELKEAVAVVGNGMYVVKSYLDGRAGRQPR